ncbi:3-dehydroquinate synthase [Candidatus Woesearchaeota archaeon]|nr:3-dehydroquinate synthase [Candidatus Woesearchaeota archaeon]
METIVIAPERRKIQYPVMIGKGTLGKLSSFVKQHFPAKRVIGVIDETVHKNHQELLKKNSVAASEIIIIPSGERYKTRETKQNIEDELLRRGYGRDTVLIAIGGGVIGDMAGFVAATYMRGIPLIHVPTTLLAMVDSSIGGKVGVNTSQGKNLIGSYWQPSGVIADLEFLETLPKQEFLNGMAEVIKGATIIDREFFILLEDHAKEILQKEGKSLLNIIKRSVEIKKSIVEADEEEQGLRQVLNFGHTIGHALEAHQKFTMKHGHAVSIGMMVESLIAVHQGVCAKEEQERLSRLLVTYGLPTTLPFPCSHEDLIQFSMLDKKTQKHQPRIVMLTKIGTIKHDQQNGHPRYTFHFNEAILMRCLKECEP